MLIDITTYEDWQSTTRNSLNIVSVPGSASIDFTGQSTTPYTGYFEADGLLDVEASSIYYEIVIDSEKQGVSFEISAKNAATEAGLDTTPYGAPSTELSGSLTLINSGKYVRVKVVMSSENNGISPVVSSLKVSKLETLSEIPAPVILAPSPNETYDNTIKITWQVPEITDPVVARALRYVLHYRNQDLGIDEWQLVQEDIDPYGGFYYFDVSELDNDTNYEIRLYATDDEIERNLVEDGELPPGV